MHVWGHFPQSKALPLTRATPNQKGENGKNQQIFAPQNAIAKEREREIEGKKGETEK